MTPTDPEPAPPTLGEQAEKELAQIRATQAHPNAPIPRERPLP